MNSPESSDKAPHNQMLSTNTSRSPWVRVIIVNYNAGAMLQACVDALAAQTMADFEAVVVDNGSTEIPISDLRLPDSRFRTEHAGANIGFAAANNLGARYNACCWLATLNPDTRPRPYWLAELRAATERYPQIRVFGSTQLDGANPDIVDGFGDLFSGFGIAWRSLSRRPVGQLPGGDCEVFSPCAAAALYAQTVYGDVGGFDESFFCYLEDIDLGFRLRLRGERCVQVRRAEVLHIGSAVTGRLSDFSVFHSYRNRIWLLVKNTPWALLAPVLLLHVATTLSLCMRPHSYRTAALRGIWAGLKGLPAAARRRKDVQRRRVIGSLDAARMMLWNPLTMRSRVPPLFRQNGKYLESSGR
jgi:N-acetylglucosaminyl-diphospho-decaprenol L-rhamnosyltransferase